MPASKPNAFRRYLAKFCVNEDGASLLEAALVAFPFLLLLFGTFEIGLRYWAIKELENATSTAARLIRTGQAHAGGMTPAAFKTQICDRTVILTDCLTLLRLDVRSAQSFSAFAPATPVDASGNLKPNDAFSFNPGGRNDVVLVTAFYQWPSLIGGRAILSAAAPMRNEPF